MDRRLFPAPDPRPFHDARAHSQWDYDREPAARPGRDQRRFRKGFADITTRQQIQLRWFTIKDVPAIWQRLKLVGLVTLQTGMDNIRNVIGCPVAGLTPNELFDASPVVREFTQMFMGNKAPENSAGASGRCSV
jgi:ferredoxin-nitrite reductase